MPLPADSTPKSYVEDKYVFPLARVRGMAQWLGLHLIASPSFPRGEMLTTYYDTVELSGYYDGKDGQYKKTRIRLREYLEDASESCSLEAKRRSGRLVFKRRTLLKRARLPADRGLSYGALLDSIQDCGHLSLLRADGMRPLVPIVAIRCTRLRFEWPGGRERCNLDFDIRAQSLDFASHWKRRAVSVPYCVFEVKHPPEAAAPKLPGWPDPGPAGFSKYGYCLSTMLEEDCPDGKYQPV